MTSLALAADVLEYMRSTPPANCACGCGRPLPALRLPTKRYYSRKCNSRAHYLRVGKARAYAKNGKMPWAERRRLGIKKRGLARDARGRFVGKKAAS